MSTIDKDRKAIAPKQSMRFGIRHVSPDKGFRQAPETDIAYKVIALDTMKCVVSYDKKEAASERWMDNVKVEIFPTTENPTDDPDAFSGIWNSTPSYSATGRIEVGLDAAVNFCTRQLDALEAVRHDLEVTREKLNSAMFAGLDGAFSDAAEKPESDLEELFSEAFETKAIPVPEKDTPLPQNP